MQSLLARYSTWRAPVWQKLEQSNANFPPSIHAKDVLTSDRHVSFPKLVAGAFLARPLSIGSKHRRQCAKASAPFMAKQTLEKIAEASGVRRLSGAYDKDGAIRMIQNAAREIAHDVMANYASRLR